MLIKQQMLAQQLQKKIAPLYVLIGQDNYLLQDSLTTIKKAIKKNHNFDEKIISIQSTNDWITIRDEANSYSLFADTVLLTIFFDKKSLDSTGKKILTEYLKSINERCFLIISAPNIPAKQLQWLSSHQQAVLTIAYPLNPESMKSWIQMQLKKHTLNFDSQVPELIHHYTQGNMLACVQAIEKIALASIPHSKITIHQAQEHLSNQCHNDLYEFVDACLLGQGDKAIQILRQAVDNKTEPTLILWLICNEIRLLMQLLQLLAQKIDLKNACQQLKIWSHRISLYQVCSNRCNTALLHQLHQYCYSIDEQIKSNLNTQVWNSLEVAALSLCLGKFIGLLCTP